MASFEDRGFVQVQGMVTFLEPVPNGFIPWSDLLLIRLRVNTAVREVPQSVATCNTCKFQACIKRGNISSNSKNICLTFNSLLTDAVTNNNIKNSSSEASSNVEGNVNTLLR